MSIQLRKQRTQRLLILLRRKQSGSAYELAQLFECHFVTIKRLVARLREDGYEIYYDKTLKKYVLRSGEKQTDFGQRNMNLTSLTTMH